MPIRSTTILWTLLLVLAPDLAHAQPPERWKAYYVNFGYPHKNSMGMMTATGEAQLAITARSIKGTVKFDGFDEDAPPNTISIERSGPSRLSGTITSEYPHPLPPFQLVGRYQRLNGWPDAVKPSPFADATCYIDEIFLEAQGSFLRTIYYFAKPCHSE